MRFMEDLWKVVEWNIQIVKNNYLLNYMSLITAAVLIKKKFNMEELTRNYYASVDVFDGGWY